MIYLWYIYVQLKSTCCSSNIVTSVDVRFLGSKVGGGLQSSTTIIPQCQALLRKYLKLDL